jgi:hypothetical protein
MQVETTTSSKKCFYFGIILCPANSGLRVNLIDLYVPEISTLLHGRRTAMGRQTSLVAFRELAQLYPYCRSDGGSGSIDLTPRMMADISKVSLITEASKLSVASSPIRNWESSRTRLFTV